MIPQKIKLITKNSIRRFHYHKGIIGSHLDRLSENTKSENFGVDIQGFMTRKSVKIPILGQPVDH